MRRRLGEMFADPGYRILSRSILGTDDPESIRARVDEFCNRTLGAAPTSCLGIAMSIGVVLELAFEDGRDAVIKIQRGDRAALAASYRVMDSLARAGLPWPRLLHPPVPFGTAIAVVMSRLTPPAGVAIDDDIRRRLMARGLVEQIRQAAHLANTADLPGPREPESPWPAPHNALFDFAGTAAGAEAIDAVGRSTAEALARIGPGPLVVGHADWSAHNVRCSADGVAAVYDCDSVRVDGEAVFAGNASVTACLDARTGFPFQPPTPADMERFLADFEEARGRPLDPLMGRIARLCALRQLGYIARCQYAYRRREGDATPSPFERALAAWTGAPTHLCIDGS